MTTILKDDDGKIAIGRFEIMVILLYFYVQCEHKYFFFFCITNLCQDCLLKQQYNVLY